MGQTAPCKVCGNPKEVTAQGRMVEHLNAQNNPCPGSYNIVPPKNITTTDGYEHLLGGAQPPVEVDLGYEEREWVEPGDRRPYPGSDRDLREKAAKAARESSLGEHVAGSGPSAPPEPVSHPHVVETEQGRVLHAPGRAPMMLREGTYCGWPGSAEGHPGTICLARRGPHEHVWTEYVGDLDVPPPVMAVISEPEPEAVEEMRTPAEWYAHHDMDLPGPDGRGGWIEEGAQLPPRSFRDPITEGEFMIRWADSRAITAEMPPPTPVVGWKQRDAHDQPLPTGAASSPDVQSMVVADIETRRQVGIERYGQALKTFNGRNTLRDAYEEALDLTIYLRSLLETQASSRNLLIQVVTSSINKAFASEDEVPPSAILAEVAVDAIIDTLTEP